MSDPTGTDPLATPAPPAPASPAAPSYGASVPTVYMIKPPIVGLTVAALCFGIPALGMALVPVVGVIIGTFLGVIAIVCGHRSPSHVPHPCSERICARTPVRLLHGPRSGLALLRPRVHQQPLRMCPQRLIGDAALGCVAGPPQTGHAFPDLRRRGQQMLLAWRPVIPALRS